jgi:hypothetical protein
MSFLDFFSDRSDLYAPPMTMKVLWNSSELLNYMFTWSATRQCIQHQGTEFLEILSKRLINVWGQTAERKETIMNFHLIAGRNQLK